MLATMEAKVRPSKAKEVAVDGERLTLVDVEAVARHGRVITLSGDVLERTTRSRRLHDDLIARGFPIYGVTTGFGDSVHRQITADRADRLQQSLIGFLGCGTGPVLPYHQARAVVLARLNCLAKGHSAVRPLVLERLAQLLNSGAAPVIPEQGSIGASGDLIPSSYIAATLMGEREIYLDGRIQPAAELWRRLGVEPIQLQSKEGLALVNGTCLMVGLGALATVDALRFAHIADVLTAMTVEGLASSDGPFNPYIHSVKAHPGQGRSAAHIRELLRGSSNTRAFDEIVDSAGALDQNYRELDVRIQDKYSIRCAPQVIGSLYDALDWITRWLETELNSANDNPLYDVDTLSVHSGGNFSGFHVALAMDTLKTCVASVLDLLDRQLELLIDEKFSNGLTPNLIPALLAGDPDEGIFHGFKCMQIAMSALAAEALNRTMPMTSFSRSTECHNQDKVSMGAAAAREARDVVEISDRGAAIHLLAACQAADLRGPQRLASRTRSIFDKVRSVSEAVRADRPLDHDILRVTELIRSGQLEQIP